jgi:phosphoserine aminotransferase
MAIVPASDTGAVEMAMWNLLGPRGVDVLVWESFGATWADDAANHLKLADVRTLDAPYGELPDLSQVSRERDVVFAWNGTTSGVRVPDADWIADDRAGLTICDATSAAFAMELPWHKLDVVTYSWQKVLGGEGQHGILILGPRAVDRLETYVPPWPLPKVFRLTKGPRLIEGLFRGETINTPSMLCVEDALDGLAWAERIGGVPALAARAEANLAAIEAWVAGSDWIEFLASHKSIRSCTSVCFRIANRVLATMDGEARNAIPKKVAAVLEAENVGCDIGGYRAAPPGLRIWAGPTVERHDLDVLFPWLDWAFAQVRPASAAA